MIAQGGALAGATLFRLHSARPMPNGIGCACLFYSSLQEIVL